MTEMPRFISTRCTFGEVLGQGDDQVLVRQLLIDLIPEDVKWRIVWHFNKSVSERNLRVVDEFPTERKAKLEFLANVAEEISRTGVYSESRVGGDVLADILISRQSWQRLVDAVNTLNEGE